ncbi:MAG: Ig-like domain-containing protein [Acidimicrobiia bacterium]|nr:Ig-like domain-containing protein [Acidimicrobiia bacterium]
MLRAVRVLLVALLAYSVLGVVPGEVEATVPGAIGRIVFRSDMDHPKGEIYIRDFAGGSPTRLTNNDSHEYTPEWSPNGARIAFSCYCSATPGTLDVFIMDPDGTNQVNLTNDAGSVNYVGGWSPDGLWIAYVSNSNGSHDLWKVRVDGSDAQVIRTDVFVDGGAAWSPDGSLVAFARWEDQSDLWVTDDDGAGATRLTDSAQDETDPAWSPDGSQIAYSHWDDPLQIGDIYVMDADGSNPVNLTNNPEPVSAYGPAWSPDGSKIAFISNIDGDRDLWVMNPDGTGQTLLIDNASHEWSVAWESVNRRPVAGDDEVDVSRGGAVAVAVLGNDSDPDGEDLVVTEVSSPPAYGTSVINSDGTITYTNDGATRAAYPYADSFDYTVQDARMGLATGTVSVSVHPFADVPPSSIFAGDVAWLATHEITKGCNPPQNTRFCPGDPVTRAQMAAFLVRALGLTDDGGGDLFVDDDGSVFEGDIDRLGTAGVTRGCNPPSNDRFCPNDAVTRGQMAAFLVRGYDLSNGQSDLFVDDDGSVFEGDIDRLGAAGVTRGCNPPLNDRYCPEELVTREQMAAFIHRAAEAAN